MLGILLSKEETQTPFGNPKVSSVPNSLFARENPLGTP
jgi:hypothetical protein